ncbi:ImpA family type VI secretion system protein [Bosea sp. LjRoot237]|uniref:type VI secretion system protein TssA n=1 Tax=Bosea sp. LjRoot237 TaxID=3342292 RepID=UPI003ECF05E3
MAALNFADLAKPVSADDPCGPDPDADPDFMNVLGRLEVALPSSYFRREDDGRQVSFDRSAIDFPAAFSDLGKILKQSRDLRGFVLAGKLCLLNRDIPGFAACLGLITSFLGDYWEEIHPRAEDGDFIMREVALQGLDENATIVLPLQHAPVFTSKRLGPVMFRSQLIALGELRASEDEQHPDAGGIAAALKEAELSDLTAMLGHVTAIRDALLRLRAVWSERLGADQAVTFPRLAGLVGQIITFLEAAVERRAPAQQGVVAVEVPGGAGGTIMVAAAAIPAGACASVAEAQAALVGCLAYFRRVEPSSPAVLLIGQAQRLVGKSLIEVIQIMFPEHVDKAMLEIGDDTKYQLPLERLGGDGYDSSSGDEDSSYDDSSGYDDSGDDDNSSSDDDEDSGTEDEPADESGDAEAETSESADDWAEDARPEADAEPEPKRPAAAAAVPAMTVANRAEAVARMKSVAAFYRHAEPSNPVPLLMDKACALAQQDFLSLLSDILPEVGIRQGSDE